MIATDRTTSRIDLPMPFGWFQVLYSDELAKCESKPLEYFGQELVAFRTESGVAKVVDAYCPHMGAHLGYGIHENAGAGASVVGESIVCPFHGWQYNGEGQCTHIPYAKNMPPRVARGEKVLNSWHVREVNQCILVWYHPQGVEPLFEPVVVPEAALDNDEWGEMQTFEWDINTHMQEIGENAVDAVHFHYVHGTDEIPAEAKHEFDGYNRFGFLATRNPTPKGVVEGSIENASYGAGLAVIRFQGICDTLLLANLTPVSADKTRAMYAFIQKKVDGKTQKGGIGAAIIANICQQMEEDRIIWDRKKYYEKPLLCDGDGPFAKFRKWYGQFLIPAQQ
ncbi:MAG: Rieske 2Fe-2S domain-containing protein [Gammaproteobacteria bacterium]|uniref:aromatic ring-hydroxylating oxygenase subunit alpha n=1 Tax=Pseudomaricurvus alcaniphilus TaxID=1166482 RepID=UPI001409B2A2|nr:Rieske 2Fe-2S domain-containing protein [Pseudomaricurvus alcaniphilus]MBR9911098.1 Rieske 2Fe-2S domain-containing protein [Gammaproteobacteria bacterium]NHN36398.1 Rieske 2Fe-2S domain-containing protein [Pseudomaricurvus alcaniphilus]